MSADLDNQPYDNVEFPIRRPAPGTQGGWISPNMTQAQRDHLVMGSATKERTHTLAPVVESGTAEEEGEESEIKVEDQRQKIGTPTTYTAGSTASSQFNNMNNSNKVITTPPRSTKMNHVTTPSKGNQLHITTDKQSNKSDTFSRTVTKPPPSPSRDSRISFVSDQSNPPEDFTWSAFTPMSQDVFENAYKRHKYFYKFSDKVLKQGTKMKTNVWDVPGKPGETMTYEQLLQGVLADGERLILGGSWLYFRAVEFFEPECTKEIKPALGEGRICLTNLRMLLLCAETASDANIVEYGDEKKEGGGYKLSVSKLNNVFYQNIPIDCFESVELSSTVGVVAESKLIERKASCCGLFSCVGVGRCGNTWEASPPLPMNVVKRFVRLGVYLPPWRTPAIMLVHLHPKMSLTSARDFVTKLQNHVPQMQYHNKHGATLL
ncbi:uncharacterized protein LOC132732728 [Ruditapes philippinarum]|uniref:uncharacterized protein LOC132732728 n=1 Tax=Ruditapes philippinarum TaxID=129788 RepID=UPI00295A7627|nr:uncharacterized protein LOC132732728 [Ruditapes philippinarum]